MLKFTLKIIFGGGQYLKWYRIGSRKDINPSVERGTATYSHARSDTTNLDIGLSQLSKYPVIELVKFIVRHAQSERFKYTIIIGPTTRLVADTITSTHERMSSQIAVSACESK